MDDVRFLSTEDVLLIHDNTIEHEGGLAGVRDLGLLDAAVAMPRQQFGGNFLHRDLAAMTAAYLYHLTKNHPYSSKRSGGRDPSSRRRRYDQRPTDALDEKAD